MQLKHPDPYANLESLLPGFCSGCEVALGRLYKQLNYRLRAYALRLTREEGAAEDIIAESFIKLWEHRTQMDSIKGLIAYLYTTIRHACYKYLRAEAKRGQAHEEWNYVTQSGAEAEDLDIMLVARIIEETTRMPVQMRVVFNLAYMEGLRATAIAERLSISVHTVQTQKKRALKRIRIALARKM